MSAFEQHVKDYAYCAETFDKPVRHALANGDSLEAIRRIAGKYRVARNFSRKFDEAVGIPRYQPVVKALAAYPPNIGINPIEAVQRLTCDLKQIYHREVLSASSKFLWFWWGREIVIYDSQALATLRKRSPSLRAKDYPAYCVAWKALFSEYSEEIARECARQGVSSERWFHERVFDWHLWRNGKKKKSNRSQ
jgi:hypothetical protein